jgi:putative transposase
VPHDRRDQVVDFVRRWSDKTGIALLVFIGWLGLARSKFFSWQERYGQVNEHNAWIPRDHWLEEAEKSAIIGYHRDHPLEGYRRLTFMMLDQNIVAASPSSVYRVLAQAGLLRQINLAPSKKGTGFVQPLQPHEHWHIDVSYLNICGTFYYLCSVLDGCSRFIVHHEIREQMKEADIQIILQRAKEKQPQARPRIISDNGPQFVAKEFKQFVRLSGMTHVRTSPYYPQSNGKLERWHGTLKRESIRPRCPLSLEEARLIVAQFVEHYNTCRLHSALGYVTPQVRLEGRQQQIFAERDRKLEAARQQRQAKRLAAKTSNTENPKIQNQITVDTNSTMQHTPPVQ